MGAWSLTAALRLICSPCTKALTGSDDGASTRATTGLMASDPRRRPHLPAGIRPRSCLLSSLAAGTDLLQEERW
ncbi:hypothetical protein GCM10018965_008910 [Nonomuraea roseola]